MAFKKPQHDTELLRKKLIAHSQPQSSISEQYRTIRTNTFFASFNQSLQSLLVTSTGPEEGKSTTIANLAIVFANQGKKVLLVDADMRKPVLHLMFHVSNHIGLTNVLAGQSSLSESYIQTSTDHLLLLPSGPIPPNPAELLGSASMQRLMERAKKEFDYILFDTPPILTVTDPQVLANQCDGSIFVVNSGVTDITKSQKAKELLLTANAQLLGVVLNNYNTKEGHYYYS